MNHFITLRSSDGQEFEIETKIATLSKTIRDFLSKFQTTPTPDAGPISLEVTGGILSKIVDYLKYHYKYPTPAAEYKDPGGNTSPWDLEFCKVDLPTISELINAANYLGIEDLLYLMCKALANIIKGKTTDQINKVFGVEGEFTFEERERTRKQQEQWKE